MAQAGTVKRSGKRVKSKGKPLFGKSSDSDPKSLDDELDKYFSRVSDVAWACHCQAQFANV